MKYPESVKKGDVIGIVAPASAVSAERKEKCIEALENLGFKVKTSDNLTASKGGFMAGDEKLRGQLFNEMFADNEVKAIICLRGGDGANRVCEFIDRDIIRKNPKFFMGYSDITSLHLIMNQECNLVTYHGPMVSSNIVEFNDDAKKAFFEALEVNDVYEYKEPDGYEIGVAREGKAEGVITGGNLTVMCASIGTPYQIQTDGKILFIEEIGSHIGNVDRLLYQLRNAGLLNNLKGIILGQFEGGLYDDENYKEPEAVLDAIGDIDIPVMYNIQSGHGEPMITIPLGSICEMNTENKSIVFRRK